MVRTQKVIFFGNITFRANDVNLKNTNHAAIWDDYVKSLLSNGYLFGQHFGLKGTSISIIKVDIVKTGITLSKNAFQNYLGQ